jgi:DNA-binding FadR family transcriptional regulator
MSAPRKAPAWSTTDAIKQHIIDSGLGPGDLMPTETELCEALGVSRSSVREAIRTLGSLDIVEVRHGHGTFVGRMSLDPLVNGMVFRLSMRGEHAVTALRNVVQTRIALDLAMTDDLVKAYNGTYDSSMHALVDDMRTHTEQGTPSSTKTATSMPASPRGGQPDHQRARRGLLGDPHPRLLLGISTPQDIMDTVEAHEAILLAVESGDVEAYCSAVQATTCHCNERSSGPRT